MDTPSHKIEDIHVKEITTLKSPNELKQQFPLKAAEKHTIIEARNHIQNILLGKDKRQLVIAGPCSVHDGKSIIHYAQKLATLHHNHIDKLYIVIRAYFCKPRTTVGWKGLINDPFLDCTYKIQTGLELTRKICVQIAEMGLPIGTEMLDTISPQYISDCISWSSIGARTVESQPHRELSSGLSMPVGFKNGTDGNIKVAISGIQSSHAPHNFLGVNGNGDTSVIKTTGNKWCHLILRGSSQGPNYSKETIDKASDILRKDGIIDRVIIDCSHGNSEKKFQNQTKGVHSVIDQLKSGSQNIAGVMLESHLKEGAQSIGNGADLNYGVSITDECIGWEETESLIQSLANAI